MVTLAIIGGTLAVLIFAATRKPQPHKSHHRRNVDTLDVRPYRSDSER